MAKQSFLKFARKLALANRRRNDFLVSDNATFETNAKRKLERRGGGNEGCLAI
jgi:hypothetical protein